MPRTIWRATRRRGSRAPHAARARRDSRAFTFLSGRIRDCRSSTCDAAVGARPSTEHFLRLARRALGRFAPLLMSTPVTAKENAIIKTSYGDMTLEFWPDVAPKHVENFKKLAREGFYNGTAFHRVIKGFMIQG